MLFDELDEHGALRARVRRIRRRPRARENQRAHQGTMAAEQRERDIAPHREPAHRGALDAARLQQRGQIVGVLLDGPRAAHRGLAEAAQVGRDAVRLRRQPAQLPRPQRAVVGPSMDEQHRYPASDLVVRKGEPARQQRDHRDRPSPFSGQCGNNVRHSSGTRTGLPDRSMDTKTIEACATSTPLPTFFTSCLTM